MIRDRRVKGVEPSSGLKGSKIGDLGAIDDALIKVWDVYWKVWRHLLR